MVIPESQIMVRANHPEFRANARDPTRTKSVRNTYARQLRKRYRTVDAAIRRLVEERDFFGLDEPADRSTRMSGFAGQAHETYPRSLPTPTAPVPRRPGYSYPSDEARIAAFRAWLRQTTDAVVLGGPGDDRWTDEYIRYAYGRGVLHANYRLKNAHYQPPDIELRDTFRLPIHQDTLGLFYQRQYELLSGVNAAMASDISRTLTEGVLRGEGPDVIAREMSRSVSGIGMTRANTIARTEVIHAYNEASLNRYERVLGNEASLQVVLEFETAGDNRVCDQCLSLEGSTYTVDDARNVIPVHANCRCTWIPVARSSS